jgi:hypothetical protein
MFVIIYIYNKNLKIAYIIQIGGHLYKLWHSHKPNGYMVTENSNTEECLREIYIKGKVFLTGYRI